jgi:beta-glucosidase
MGKGSTEMNLRKEKARELVEQMTLEEKAGLCSGKDQWRLKKIERLGLNTIMVSDGPHGLRKQLGTQDNLGIGDSAPSVCFPTSSALACSFDRELAYEVGKAIGEECLQEGVSVVLGPGVNLKRSPLCGRNFEYYSEDPTLSGELAVGMIQGVQSQGIGTSLKHFAANNQEKRRMTVSAVVDERALRETYLKAFEIAVKKGKPRTVMCAYNRMNGEYCSENSNLLTKILREEWGYEGLVLSDWGAVNDRVLGIKAGMDLEMPGSRGINDSKIVAAVKNNTLPEQELDKVACRITELILEGMEARQEGYHYDVHKHHQLAVRAEEQSAVLLKNKDKILPGKAGQKAAVIGVFAKEPRYQGAGSSKIHPIHVDNTWDALVKNGMNVSYAQGYSIGNDKEREAALIKEACDVAKGKDVVYVFAGLPEGYESEGFDRTNLSLPESQNRLIAAVSECNPEVVVILFGGAPMELPWEDKVKGILLAYLGGEGVGKAIAKLLLGKVVPSGKLAETWPLRLSDNPSYSYFPGGRTTVEYRESIYIGYRYYEKAGKPVRYPFGHGLSYASFAYSELMIDQEEYNYGDKVKITFQITNLGTVDAKETALIFVSHQNDKVFLPVKELREFIKISLQPGERKSISVELDTKSFAYYNTIIHDWYAGSGDYKIMVGPSSADCPLEGIIRLNSPDQPQPDFREKAPSYYRLSNQELAISEHEFSNLYGGPLPEADHKPSRPYDQDNTLEDVSHTLLGKLIIKVADHMSRKVTKASQEEEGMMSSTIKEMPFHSLVTSSDGIISEPMMEGIIEFLNGHYLKGLHKLFQKK